jgi:hypothetical protein
MSNANASADAKLGDFTSGLKRSRKSLKHVLRRIDGSAAKATFDNLRAERRQAMTAASAAIDRQIEALRKDMKAALRPDGDKAKN